MLKRSRRNRFNDSIRRLTRETRVSSDSLVYPMFIREGSNIKAPISSMEGQFHVSVDRAAEEVEKALESGVNKLLLFGIPDEKDETGSGGYAENGVVQQAVRSFKQAYGNELYIITDVCMCEYTSHGHCGILCGDYVDNDQTLGYLQKIAVSHARAGADMVAPSDMMDGRVLAIRNALDAESFINTGVMAYSVKYASSFYGPFREAAGSTPSFGDRKTYQMDYHNKKEALKAALSDIDDGADIIIVKPAMSYLDVVSEVSKAVTVPVAAYSVSGEYAMMKQAGKAGLINEYGVMCETAAAVFRAGANILITYYAKELAAAIKKGDIG